MYLPNATAKGIRLRVKNILDKLQRTPLYAILPTNFSSGTGLNYGIVDRALARRVLFTALYEPRRGMLAWFAAMVDAEHGDGRAMYDISDKQDPLFRCPCNSSSGDGQGEAEDEGDPMGYRSMELEDAIACSDAGEVEADEAKLRDVQKRLRDQSEFAEFWVMNIRCSGWKIRAAERITGPVGANETSHPILFLANTADPVTPSYNAHQVSKRFPRSVVLTQNSTGHCSLSAPSTCTAKYVRRYFKEGILPDEGTLCEPEEAMFASSFGSGPSNHSGSGTGGQRDDGGSCGRVGGKSQASDIRVGGVIG